MITNIFQPPAPPPPTVAQALLHYLILEGVTHVFGIPGGGLANLLVEFKNQRDKITYVICRHEGGAAYIADGYFRATGKLGVVMMTSGPGATNALTGVMNAQNDGSALLAISGEVEQQFFGRGYLQEGIDASLDVDAIYKSATGYSVVISAGCDCETLFRQALRDALSLPRQAVHIGMPNNVSVEPITCTSLPSSTGIYRAAPMGVPMSQVRIALESLLAAKRPLILLGNGTRTALRDAGLLKQFTAFVERYAIPVVTTSDGKGVFPEDHPLSLRVYGFADCIWPYYWLNSTSQAYDGLLVLGSSLGELSTNKWHPMLIPQGGPFIQVDINQSIIGRGFEITHGIVGEAGEFIRAMAELSPQYPPVLGDVSTRSEAVAAIKTTYSPFHDAASYASDASPMLPPALMRICNETLPNDCLFFVDAGNCAGWGAHYFIAGAQRIFHSSLSMGPMGFGVGAVVGAKIGCPDRVCVALVGDGAFMMHGAEVSTAKAAKCGAIWIVLSDNNLSMVSQGQANFFPDPSDPKVWADLYQLGDPDLVKFAEGLGAAAVAVSTTAEMQAALLIALEGSAAGVPQVIVARIDRSQIPPYYNPLYGGPPKASH